MCPPLHYMFILGSNVFMVLTKEPIRVVCFNFLLKVISLLKVQVVTALYW